MKAPIVSLVLIGLSQMLQANPEPAQEPAVSLPAIPLVSGGRDFSQFEFLLKRSPFSLPTAEEKSPLADRYTLTGAASWDGKQRVFILDKVTQTRHMVDDVANPAGIALLEFFPNPERPREMKARVRLGAEVATLTYAEPPPMAGAMPGAQPLNAGVPNPSTIPNPNFAPNPPNGAVLSNASANGSQPTNRRVFRRRVISGPNTPPTP